MVDFKKTIAAATVAAGLSAQPAAASDNADVTTRMGVTTLTGDTAKQAADCMVQSGAAAPLYKDGEKVAVSVGPHGGFNDQTVKVGVDGQLRAQFDTGVTRPETVLSDLDRLAHGRSISSAAARGADNSKFYERGTPRSSLKADAAKACVNTALGQQSKAAPDMDERQSPAAADRAVATGVIPDEKRVGVDVDVQKKQAVELNDGRTAIDLGGTKRVPIAPNF